MIRKIAAFLLAGIAAMGMARAQEAKQLNIYNWNDYIAEDTIRKFEAETGIKVRYDVYDSNEVLDAKLRAGRSGYDVVVPTASPFLAQQIPAKALRPLDRAKLANHKNLDPAIMRQLEAYDPGNRFAIPWLWGTTGFGYNVGKIRQLMKDAPVDSLRMMFDPAMVAKFKGCGVTMLDSATDVLPAALAYAGLDPDSHTVKDLDKAIQVMSKVRPSIRKFHSSDYIEGLANGDYCLAFGFSGDILQAADRARQAKKGVEIAYVIPREGAQVWIDTMAIPADAPHPDNAHRFLDFIMRPEIIAATTNFRGYANGNAASLAHVDPAIRANPAIYPPEDVRRRLFTVSVPSRDYERQRTRAWTRITRGR